MKNKIETHVLKLSCKDQVGIVSKISTLLANFKCNIVESKQFTDQQNGNFFIRQSFTLYDSSTLSKLEKNLYLLIICTKNIAQIKHISINYFIVIFIIILKVIFN